MKSTIAESARFRELMLITVTVLCTEDLLLSCPFSGDGPEQANSYFALRALAASIANIVNPSYETGQLRLYRSK